MIWSVPAAADCITVNIASGARMIGSRNGIVGIGMQVKFVIGNNEINLGASHFHSRMRYCARPIYH